MNFFASCEERLNRLSEERFYLILLSIATVLVAALMTLFALDLHRNFLTIACDTAAFQNTIVNTLDGRWFRDTAYNGPNYLGLHNIPVLLLIAPIYAVYPSADLLFVLQVWGVYSTMIPLYLLGVEILRKPPVAFLIAATALASPIFFHMALAPFHPESWILAAVLWSCLFYRRNQWRGFWISLVFGLSCGEQAPLIYLALGLSWLLCEDGLAWRKRYAKCALAAGFAWLILSVGIVTPSMHSPGQQNLVAYNYSNWGIHSFMGLAGAVAHDPFRALGLLFSPSRWFYLFSLVGLSLVMAFFSLRILILLLPFPVFFLMNDQEFFLYFHAYYFQFAFLAGYLGLIFILSRPGNLGRIAITLLASTILLNILLLLAASVFYFKLEMSQDTTLNNAVHQAFTDIPREAGVYSPHRFSAYLSNHENMVMGDLREPNFDFDAMIDAQYATTNVHSGEIDYIVCDQANDQCGWRQGGYNPDIIKIRSDNLNHLLQSGKWQMQWNQDGVVILRRAAK